MSGVSVCAYERVCASPRRPPPHNPRLARTYTCLCDGSLTSSDCEVNGAFCSPSFRGGGAARQSGQESLLPHARALGGEAQLSPSFIAF